MNTENQKDPNFAARARYRFFFVLGLVFLPVGLATDPAFIGLGVVFFIIGGAGLARERKRDGSSQGTEHG